MKPADRIMLHGYKMYSMFLNDMLYYVLQRCIRSSVTGYLTISRRRRSEYRLVITEPHEATNCFSINFQVLTNNNRLNFTKIHFKFITVLKSKN